MGKRNFNNIISLRGADNINKVIAPSRDARTSDLRISNVIKGLICRSLDDCLRNRGMTSFKRGMTFILWILVSSTSMAGAVKAECVPLPDCASIGYTATSCDGGFVRCPFDTSKLFCIPCDTKYKYTCTQTGQKGKGTSCDGKYIECECNGGYDLVDGNCVISCAYTLTSFPTGCSAVSDFCIKNGTTYYSSTCTSCKAGYTINSGTCKANTCSGYYTSISYCASYEEITCLSGNTIKYKCATCDNGFVLHSSSGQCIDEYCYDYFVSENGYEPTTIYNLTGSAGSCPITCTGPISGKRYGISKGWTSCITE